MEFSPSLHSDLTENDVNNTFIYMPLGEHFPALRSNCSAALNQIPKALMHDWVYCWMIGEICK